MYEQRNFHKLLTFDDTAMVEWYDIPLLNIICSHTHSYSKALPYREQLIALFKLLHQKTFSKRGFSSSGKLVCSTLLTLTHTYPLENKFVNPDEWSSEGEFNRKGR